MMSILFSVIGVIITILLIVGVHELGHFLTAKYFGIKVIRFSIGFGKKIFSWHDKSGTEYVLAAIPLGGYVKMLDESEGEVAEADLESTFNQQAYYKKVAVIAAGPLSNLVFAFFLYWILYVVGFITIAPTIGKVAPNSIAAYAGLQPKQEIIEVDGKEIHNWTSLVVHLIARAGDKSELLMRVKNLGAQASQSYTLNLANWHLNELKPDPIDSLGITPYEPNIPATITTVLPNSAAEKSGLKPGDKVISVDGEPTNDWIDLMTLVVKNPDQLLMFKLQRDKQILTIPVKVGHVRDLFFARHGHLGIANGFTWPKELLHLNKYGPIAALPHAWQEVKLFSDMNFIIFGKMLTGKVSFKSLGGPITIFEYAGVALNHGAIAFMSFLAFLSISIGIINIIPIPGLDGGHLLIQSIESITRRPISERWLNLFYRLGLLLLMIIMVQALANDILRL